jgi:FMN-dependent NADH-azoreductase
MRAARLLHLDASPRGERSRSRPVAQAWIDALSALVPVEITRIDLFAATLPPLGPGMIEGRYARILGDAVDPAIARDWDRIDAIGRDFLSHDAILIATPMWNFGIPYPLKHYVDCVTQPGIAFTNDAAGNVIGHAAGRPAMIVAASAMDIAADGPLAAFDFQLSYLERWLGFIGVTDIHAIRIAPTYGPEDRVRETVARAADAARAMAAAFAQSLNAARE